jgi:aldehyde:ferredoxin oxidoreductase
MGGFMGKILWVDLSTGGLRVESLPEEFYRKYIGGYGLASRLIYEHQEGGCEALGPDALLAFAAGPLVGTTTPGTGRFVVAGKSPLTGTWGDANCGGFFGPEMKAAGYDAIMVRGQADHPVYLSVADGKPTLRDATHLWGLDSYQTEDAIHAELGDRKTRIACIGPAGESQSLIACVMHDKGRAAGRSGLGAVMGAKRLKAIALRGGARVPVADRQLLAELRAEFCNMLRENPTPAAKVLMKYGTAGNVTGNLTVGASAPRNWSLGGKDSFPEVDLINGENVIKYQKRRYACSACPVGCGGVFEVPDSRYPVVEVHKPEYETLAGFGTLCLNSNVESIIKANEICNRAGIDTISASTAVAFAMECYEAGVLNGSDADGLELVWGNHDAIVALTERIARRDGLGAILADGVRVAAERIGRDSERFAVHVHGQEPGYHDSKLFPSRGTTYVADPTPGRHTAGTGAWAEMGRTSPHPDIELPSVERYQYTGKGAVHAAWSNHKQVGDAAGLCIMVAAMPFPLEKFVSAVTGWDYGIDELLLTGERIQTVRHSFNVREGLRPSDFRLPDRLAGHPPLTTGPTAGITLDIDSMVEDYYLAMGWDPETGVPSKDCLEKLGLANLIGQLA